MKLLLKREQTTGKVGRVNFKLWAKIEIDDDERALIKRYKFDEALLMGENESSLVRKCITYGILIAILAAFIFDFIFPSSRVKTHDIRSRAYCACEDLSA